MSHKRSKLDKILDSKYESIKARSIPIVQRPTEQYVTKKELKKAMKQARLQAGRTAMFANIIGKL